MLAPHRAELEYEMNEPPELDYEAQLTAIKDQLSTAQQRRASLLAAKEALGAQRQEIVDLCQRAGVQPSREAILEALSSAQAELATLLTTIDTLLKKETQ